MSHFGNSPRTAETERRMTAWRKANPDALTSEYNRAYVNTWNSLTEFSDREVDHFIEDTSGRPGHYFIEMDPFQRAVEASKVVKPRKTGSRPPRHRKPETKGAFGKKR